MAGPYERAIGAGREDEDDLEVEERRVGAQALDMQCHEEEGDEAARREYVERRPRYELGQIIRRINDRHARSSRRLSLTGGAGKRRASREGNANIRGFQGWCGYKFVIGVDAGGGQRVRRNAKGAKGRFKDLELRVEFSITGSKSRYEN